MRESPPQDHATDQEILARSRPTPAAAGRRSIEEMDFHACRLSGAAQGWHHAVVTFGRDGKVAWVETDLRNWMSPAASDCLRARIATASTAPFEGPPVTVDAWFFVF